MSTDPTAILERRLAKDPAVVARQIAGETILVPIRHQASDVDSIYTMNEVGGRIWELIDGQRPGLEIRDILVSEFEVDPETLEADLIEFIQQLQLVGAVKGV